MGGAMSAPQPQLEALAGDSVMVDAGEVRLHLLEYGRGRRPDVVIVPGITSPAPTWEFVAADLGGDCHVLTLDVRGRGLSDKPATGFTLPDYAADLAAVVRELDLDRPVMVGHSMGARIAAAFGVLHRDLRGPLLAVDPPLTGPGREPYATPLDSFVESLHIAQRGATADDMRPYFPTWSDEHLALRAEWLATCDETAVVETYRLLDEEDFFGLWSRLDPPVTFLYGSESPAVTAEGAREVVQANPRAEVRVVEGAGHMIPWDRPGPFCEEVRRFLTTVTSRAGHGGEG
jgi:N-formylmaleamate deformylase